MFEKLINKEFWTKEELMAELSGQDIERAYFMWRRYYEFLDVDRAVKPFLADDVLPFSKNTESWLRRARLAQLLTVEAVAKNMGVAKNVYWKMERAEESGAVTLESLERAAAAMDCEMIFAIRPRERKIFSKLIWQKLYQTSQDHPWVRSRPKHLKANALAAVCRQNFGNLRFRKKQGWSLRREITARAL